MTSSSGALAAPSARLGRWTSWLGLPLAAALILAGSSPRIGQLLPRYLLPTLAFIGGVWATIVFVRAALRLARGDRTERGANLRRFTVALVGVVLLAVLPLSRLLGVLMAPSTGRPHILAAFGDWLGSEGYPLPGPHRGVDLAGRVGTDVLAAADGRVVVARDNRDVCGLIVGIIHQPEGYRTVYCHFSEIVVRPGDAVRRGQRIGSLGTTGQRAFPGYEHVHLEVQRSADINDLEDPMRRMVGCFDATATYPTDRLVLTYPLPCREGERR
jgi:murein DD-endopeptidase MepM/ murein hydrolase activator NlpD